MSSSRIRVMARGVVCILMLLSGIESACNDRDTEILREAGADATSRGSSSDATVDRVSSESSTDAGDASLSAVDAAADADAADARDTAPVDAGLYANTVLSDSPLLYYRLGEASGPVAANAAASGSAFNGSFSDFDAGAFSRPGLIANDPNTAVMCVGGGSDAGTISGSISLPINTATSALKFAGAFTIEAWVTRGGATSTYTIVSTKGAGKDGYSFGVVNTHLFLACHGQVNFGTTLVVPNDGSTHYVAAVFDGTSSVTFYLDGQSATVNSPTPVVNTYVSTTSLAVCRFAASLGAQSFGWNGIVDELALYPTALSPARIAAHRTAGGQ